MKASTGARKEGQRDRREAGIYALIEQQLRRRPQAPALQYRGLCSSRSRLAADVAATAAALQAAGLRAGEPVALLLPRGPGLVHAMLAAAHLAAPYLPLDPTAPAERLAHMLRESGARHIVGSRAYARGNVAGDPALLLEGPWTWLSPQRLLSSSAAAVPAQPAGPDALFCILYTSGSTGVPKGVELTQRNVANCLLWMQRQYRLGSQDRVLFKTPATFDVSMYELFWPLLAGATVVLAEDHRDAAQLATLMRTQSVTAAHFVPSMLAAFLEEPEALRCDTLQQVFAAGEALSPALAQRVHERLPRVALHNLYGPTEAGVVSHWTCRRDDPRGLVPIGHAVDDTQLHVLDEQLDEVPSDTEGELYIGGVQLARGYVNRPDLTVQRFLRHPRLGRLYRSGDRVRRLDDGALEYLGRRDHQIKLRGQRIELGEIEARLDEHPQVVESVAGLRDGVTGEPMLVAWLQPRGETLDLAALRAWLAQRLPPAMQPQRLVPLAQLPHLPNGKIDRKALPDPAALRPELAQAYAAPRTPLEQALVGLWEAVLGIEGVGVDDRFLELGGTSLQALQLLGRLREQLGCRVPLARLFAAPTVASFAALLEREHGAAAARWIGNGGAAQPADDALPAFLAPARSEALQEPIAIVGMACRVPGASDVEAFWQLLTEGREGVRDLDAADLAAAGVAAAQFEAPDYVRRAGTLEAPYAFDAAFFGYTPREAELMDPQQRQLLQCAWQALEHAGIAPGQGQRVGVYAGVAHNQYFDRCLAGYDQLRCGDDGFATLLATDKDYAATRLAYCLDLRGPAVTLQTACSSSGVALHLACQGLRQGDCEAAIVGGVRVNVPDAAGYRHVDGGPQARDGRVRPFDAQASGMLLSSGVACLVLRPLSRALAAGERVYAVVRGSAINNDGADKAGYTAPSESGQLAVIRAALQAAGIAPETVGYIEAHGTGTALGDPIEVAALNRAYDRAERIALGSVKANIGHLDAGAGAISLLKTALMLHRGQLPPQIHYAEPNPECAFEQTPFFVNTELRDWPADSLRRAAVSSFGFGGTNFHGLLEEPPPQVSTPSARAWQLLRLSARSDEALREQARQLAAYLAAQPQTDLADVAWTLATGRARLPRRASVVASDLQDAIVQLSGELRCETPADARPSLVWMFPGQGAQHPNMGRELFEREPLFRDWIERCAQLLRPELGLDLCQLLYPADGDTDSAAARLRQTEFAQPAIFAISWATAKLWDSWGLRPDAMVGHSLGELVAATLGGVFALEDALSIVAARGRLMQQMPAGSMLALRLTEQEAQPWLRNGIVLGGINAPGLVVLSGPHAALSALQAELQQRQIGCTPLQTSHAFHSPMMDPMVQPFAAIVARRARGTLAQPVVSTLSGSWATAEDLREPFHWARQLREPVRFASAVAELLKTPGRVFLEVGPGQTLSAAVRQTLRPEQRARVVASLPHSGQPDEPALRHLLQAAGALYAAGVELDATRCYAGEQRLRVGLPGYPFARRQHYIVPAQAGPTPLPAPAVAASEIAPEGSDPRVAALLPLLSRLTGQGYAPEQHERTFLELGFDSLMLTQLASQLQREFRVELRFRRLLEDLNSIARLAAWLGQHGQLQSSPAAAPAAPASTATATAAPAPAAFGPGVRIRRREEGELDARQREALAALQQRYLARTRHSRAYAQQHRAVLADPRTVSGFRPLTKEMVYPIVVDRSEGAYLWDLDGNRYVDATCGFGSMFFGHKPRFLQAALTEQLQAGWEIGPQTPLAGECARLFTEAVGLPRVAFCNTGSEAVLAAVRLARTVTGRKLIVSFQGDYHGIHDEVLVRAGADGRSLPAAPGIPPESVANTLVLEYGAPASLELIRARADDIAGVLIEPVQSRHPELQPRRFLQELRLLTEEAGIAFIMDEVITGFRSGLTGAQGYYGVKADIGIYGKVFGGGMPVGAVAGIPRYLDALDGGQWRYGDSSQPEAGVTYFAGTFVRHPLTLAAVRASLLKLLAQPEWPLQVAERTRQMVERLNEDLQRAGAPLQIQRYSSLWKPAWEAEPAQADLLYYLLRERGIHIWEGRPCFLSTAHDEADCEQIVEAFRDAVLQMQEGGFLECPAPSQVARALRPPRPQARIGRDRAGNPAWFVPDPERPGHYLQLERAA